MRRSSSSNAIWVSLIIVVLASSLTWLAWSGRGADLALGESCLVDSLGLGETRTYTIDGVDYETTLINATTTNATFSINGDITAPLSEYQHHTFSSGLDIKIFNTTRETATFGLDCQGGPSCFDSIPNQNEVGPDCGGICGGYYYGQTCNDAPPVPHTCYLCIDKQLVSLGPIEMAESQNCTTYGAMRNQSFYEGTGENQCANPSPCTHECEPGDVLCAYTLNGTSLRCEDFDGDGCTELGEYTPDQACSSSGCSEDWQCALLEVCRDRRCTAANATCLPYFINGEPTNKIDVVFLFGYLLLPLGTSDEALNAEIETVLSNSTHSFLNMAPYAKYKQKFNFWYIPAETVKNSWSESKSVRQGRLSCPFAEVVVLFSDIRRPHATMGFPGWVTTVRRAGHSVNLPGLGMKHFIWAENDRPALVFAHEMAHLIGTLDDEYEEKGITTIFTTCKNESDGFSFLKDHGTAFRGCGQQGYYRNSNNSIMRDTYGVNGDAFNAASFYYLEREMEKW